jgi:hypothetical protein
LPVLGSKNKQHLFVARLNFLGHQVRQTIAARAQYPPLSHVPRQSRKQSSELVREVKAPIGCGHEFAMLIY